MYMYESSVIVHFFLQNRNFVLVGRYFHLSTFVQFSFSLCQRGSVLVLVIRLYRRSIVAVNNGLIVLPMIKNVRTYAEV